MLEWSDAPHDRMDVQLSVSTWVKMASSLGPVWQIGDRYRPDRTQGTGYETLPSGWRAPLSSSPPG